MAKTKHHKKTIDDYIDVAQSNQRYCSTCQPYESGECIWIRGIQYSMPDFLEELCIPSKYWEKVACALNCSTCGAGLDITCDVGTATEQEIGEDDLWKSWYETHSFRFQEFYEHLERYPYLGLSHALGMEIAQEIEKLPKESLPRTNWFRGRRVDNCQLLNVMDMFPPDPKHVPIPEGRYNHFRQCVFYLSENKESAAREVLGNEGGLAWVQEFELSGTTDIANLSKGTQEPDPDTSAILFGLSYTHVLVRPVERFVGWKPEYFVPRFIADCVKQIGFKGIIFRSPHHYADNLVLFSPSDCVAKPVGTPSVITLKKEEAADF